MSLKYKIRNFVKKSIPKALVRKYKLLHSEVFPVVKEPSNVFQHVYSIKDNTWEMLYMPEIYQLSKPYNLQLFHKKQDILLLQNAQVSSYSDIIVTKEGVVWDKYDSDVFAKVTPMDGNHVEHTMDTVTVRKSSICHFVKGECISMLGTFESVWSHFLVQFLPKLYYAVEAGILDRDVTLLLPKYKDKQIEQLVFDLINRYPKLKILRIERTEERVSYKCEKLFYIPTASMISNHSYNMSFYDGVIPQRVLNEIRNNVVIPYINLIKDEPVQYEKIFFVRKSWRNITNIKEIEEYFKSKGFYFVDLASLTLEEKVKILYHAKIIVGPASSAWSNVIFCNSCKALLLNNLGRLTDSFSRFLMPLGNVKTLMVTGWDSEQNIHTDYYIPISRIDDAYQKLLD